MKEDSVIKENIERLIELCKKYKVDKLYAFGSVLTDRFNQETSDIDLIAELEQREPIEKGEALMNFWSDLENLFKKKVDLLSDRPIRNPYLKESINKTKQLIYDRRSEKVFI